MKKTYSKPTVYIENFSLSTSIAGNCSAIVGNPSEGTCSVNGTGGINVFNSNIDACDFTPEEMGGKDDMWDGFCYHVPTDAKDLFNS